MPVKVEGKMKPANPNKQLTVKWFPSTITRSGQIPLRWFLENNKTFYCDRRRLQRLLARWSSKRRNSYLYDLLRGCAGKDVIILAELEPIVDYIKDQLLITKDPEDRVGLEESLKYFENLIELGYKYLTIDGQHRIEEIYSFFHMDPITENEEPFHTPTRKPFVDFKIQGLEQELPYDLNGMHFQEMQSEIRDCILDEVKLLTTIVCSGDIKQLKLIFVGANSGTPMTRFEKLIVESWGPVARHILDLADPKKQSEHVINIPNKFANFSGDYDVQKKGLDFVFSEMLLYVMSKYGTDQIVPMFGTNGKEGLDLIFGDNYVPSPESVLKFHKKNILTIANGMAKVKASKALGRSSLCNAFILLCMMGDDKHFRREGYDLPNLNVKDPVEFMKWFVKTETDRIKKDRFITQDGKVVYKPGKPHKDKFAMKSDHCYAAYLRTVWGAAHLEFREKAMLDDLFRDWKSLELQGILSKEGESVINPEKHRLKLASKNHWMDDEGNKLDPFDIIGTGSPYDVGHKIHKSDSGDASIENTQLEYSSANRSKGAN